MKIAISNLERSAENGFVTTVHWTITKKEGANFVSQYGADYFTHTAGDLIPYEQLTSEIVTGWLKDRWGAEGLAAKEAALDAELAAAAAPKLVFGTPW